MPHPLPEEFNQLKHDTESIHQMTDEYLLKILEAVKKEIENRVSINSGPAMFIISADVTHKADNND